MSQWKMGVIKLNQSGIIRALRLDDHTIKYITIDNDLGELTLIIEGPQMPPVMPGESLRVVTPVYETQPDGDVILKEIQWQTPDGDLITG